MNLIEMQPLGFTPGIGHIRDEDGTPHDVPVSLPTWPHSPLGAEFRAYRVSRNMGLRAAAEGVGLTAEQLSGLERGRYDLSPEDWSELRAKLWRAP